MVSRVVSLISSFPIMKATLILPFLLALVVTNAPAEPASFKQFTNGSSSRGYVWQYCHEGEQVNYSVFSYLDDSRRRGESQPQTYVKVLAAGGRHPKATLISGHKSQVDLLAATK